MENQKVLNSEIIEISLPTEPFSVEKMQDLEINGQLKDYQDAKNYIFSYYFETTQKQYLFYNVSKDEFEINTNKEFKTFTSDKLTEQKLKTALKKNSKIFEVITEIGKPRIFKQNNLYYLNEAGCFLHKNYKKFDEYDEKTKSNVQCVIDMIKELTCNNDDVMLNCYLKYYAQLARGKKTEIIPYRKTPEGTGKSTETTFIIEYVFGRKLCLLCNTSDPIVTSYNKILLGKLFVVFEELPTFSEKEWNGVQGKLKSLCTEKRCIYADKYEKSFEANNISNFIINTNMNAIKDSGRRILPMDFSLKRKGDIQYFDDFKKRCYNLKTGEAFYSYLMTKITDEEANNFYGQRDFPETQNKRIAISNSLPSAYKFIKETFILKNVGMNKIKPKELLQMYNDFCTTIKIKPLGRNEFYKKLEEVNIIVRKSNIDIYNYSFNELQTIAEKEKWICMYDEFDDDNVELDLQTEHEKEINEYKKQITELKTELEKLKNQQKFIQQNTETIKPQQPQQPKQYVSHVVESDDEDKISVKIINKQKQEIKTKTSTSDFQTLEELELELESLTNSSVNTEQSKKEESDDLDIFKNFLKMDNATTKPKKR